MVNHKWNVLKALRFYNHIGKPFTVETYFRFYATPVKRETIFKEVRTHTSAKRIVSSATGLLLTAKGLRDLVAWEHDMQDKAREKRALNYTAKGHARPNTRTSTGQFDSDDD